MSRTPNAQKGTPPLPITRTLFLSDVHCGATDWYALDVALKCAELLGPERVVLGGDMLDAYMLSSFDHDPEAENFQTELDEFTIFAGRLRGAVGKQCHIDYFPGNHEARLTKWLWRNPAIFGLKSLCLPTLMGLDTWDIEYHEESVWLANGNLCLTHGTCAGMYPAAAELRKRSHGSSGVSGHVHRFSTSMATQRIGENGEYRFAAWWSVGCLCSLKPEYMSCPNWQQGFATIYTSGGDWFSVTPSLIIGRKTMLEGREVRLK